MISLLLAYDKCDVTKKLQEFEYMWNDTQDKLMENDPSLSDVDIVFEIVFAQHTNGNVGMNFYWGRRCFAQGHYAQALKHFLNAYNIVRYESTSAVSDALSAMCLLLHWILLVWDEKI